MSEVSTNEVSLNEENKETTKIDMEKAIMSFNQFIDFIANLNLDELPSYKVYFYKIIVNILFKVSGLIEKKFNISIKVDEQLVEALAKKFLTMIEDKFRIVMDTETKQISIEGKEISYEKAEKGFEIIQSIAKLVDGGVVITKNDEPDNTYVLDYDEQNKDFYEELVDDDYQGDSVND
jgi:hypothetical protein